MAVTSKPVPSRLAVTVGSSGSVSTRSPMTSAASADPANARSEEHTSELQSPCNLVCRLLLEKKKNTCEAARSGGHDDGAAEPVRQDQRQLVLDHRMNRKPAERNVGRGQLLNRLSGVDQHVVQ